ncbi:MAG: tubulin-like doman-containing protein [Defluviitaleaceae bacterium]|nr:tubulin-like doman-containing protein [Defluviitaleaceae bacterium]
MKQITHENIKQMDISLGGGIFGEKARIDTINHPVLVIGLGGTGTDALLRLKYQISRRFKLPENQVTKQKKAKPDNIEYLALETNEHDRKKYKGMSLDPYTEMALLSNAGIGAILNNRSTMPDYIKSWLNPELTITDGTKGASGNRQAGRLLLFEKINTVVDAIGNKIRSLRTEQENKLLVFMLSGLSGGTGGGMFLDVAYIIRGIMEREYGSKGVDKVEITGYLVTPDVHLAGNNMSIHTEEYIQRNGYAALKELDYFMNIEERMMHGLGERFSQKYGTRLDVNSALAPFNLCHLVSACNIDGVMLKGAYDYCMNVIAENIVNFLALEDKESGNEFAIQDYHSNLISNIGTMKSNLPQEMPHCANFCYNIIGASSAAIPTEGINSYLAYSLFTELSPMFEAEPDDHELQQFADSIGLDINALGADLARNLPTIKLDYAETDYYSYQNVIKTRRVNVAEKLEEQYTAAKRNLSDSREFTTLVIEKIKNEIRDIFLKRGAFYVTRLITSDRNPCLLARLDAYMKHLQEKISQLAQEQDAYEITADTRLEEAAKALFFSRENKKNAYIESKIHVYQTKLQKDCYTRLGDIYKEIRLSLEQENDKTYAPLAEILKEVNKVLSSNATLLQDSPDESAKNYQWDVISVTDTATEIEKTLKEIGYDNLHREFNKSLLENSTDITQTLSDHIYDSFSEFLSHTMSEFTGFRYGKDRLIESVIESEIAPRLYRDAKPIFDLDNAAGIFNFPSYGMVSVPANTPDILRGIEAYQGHALANLRFNIRKSSITDRIFWLNTQNGIPLFAYTPIRVYEELYERTINTREGVGRHLVMNEKENWRDLPSPIPEKLWGDTYTNSRQKQLNDKARQIYQKSSHKYEEDFFIRCPKLIEKSAGTDTDQTDDFLRVLVCEAIVKRGAQYLFEKELEDDPWPPFVNLIDHADYPEYAMFSTYKKLEASRKTALKRKAKSHEEKWPEEKLIIALKKWQGKIAVRKNQLDNEIWKHPHGQTMYSFYKNALLRLNSQLSALAG